LAGFQVIIVGRFWVIAEVESDAEYEGHLCSSGRWNKGRRKDRCRGYSHENRWEVLKKCDFRCSRDTSGSDREERSPRSALIEIGQKSPTVEIHIPIPQYRRAKRDRYWLLSPHKNRHET